MIIVSVDSIIDMLTPGTIIWRHTYLNEGPFGITCTTQSFSFIKNPSGTWSCRTMLPGPDIFEPVAIPGRGKGIVTFIDSPPPNDWTHLVVTKLARNKKAIFVKYVSSLDEETFLNFKLNASYYAGDDKLEYTKANLIDLPEGISRLHIHEEQNNYVTEQLSESSIQRVGSLD